MTSTRIKKAIAAGMFGLTALGATAVAPSIADAQDTTVQQEREARHAEHRANREARRAERIALLTEVLGVGEDELEAAREAGQSIADLATAQGVPVEDVVAAIVEAQTAHIQERVAAGDITQAEADERIGGLTERVTERVNAAPGERGTGHGGPRGPRGPRGGEAPAGA